MPLSPDLDPEADLAVRRLLRGQPGHAIPQPVRIRVLSALADEAAIRAALYDNDVDPTPASEPLTKTVRHQPSPAVPLTDSE